MTHTGKRMGDVLRVLAAVIVFGTLISTTILNYKKSTYNGFKGAFWENRAANYKMPVRARDFKSRDVSTPDGWRGTVKLGGDHERMEMHLVDRHGKPVRGLRVAVRIARPGSGSTGPYRVMPMEPDGRYRSGKLNLGKGQWNLTVTARDDKATDRPPLKFRIEKQVTVNKELLTKP